MELIKFFRNSKERGTSVDLGLKITAQTIIGAVDAGQGTLVYHIREGTHEKFSIVRCALRSELDAIPTCAITQNKLLDNFALESAVQTDDCLFLILRFKGTDSRPQEMFLARFDTNHSFISEDKKFSKYEDGLYRIDEILGSVTIKMYGRFCYLLFSSSIDRLVSKSYLVRMRIIL